MMTLLTVPAVTALVTVGAIMHISGPCPPRKVVTIKPAWVFDITQTDERTPHAAA